MNYYDHTMQVGITAVIWSCWCIIHSLLNSDGFIVKTFLRDSSIRRFYRLLYSVGSALTLLLVYWLTPRENDILLWEWSGPFLIVQGIIWVIALFIGYLSFRLISIWDFLGFRALWINPNRKETLDRLITSGIYAEIRHPQFLAGLMLLWARDITRTGLVINAVLSLYLIIGARIEEKRLVRKFGDEYLEYMARVPRFIPRRFPPLKFFF